MKRASPSAAPAAFDTQKVTQDLAAKRRKEEEKGEEQCRSIAQEDAAKKSPNEEEIEVVDLREKSSSFSVKDPILKRQLLSLNPGLDSPSTSVLNEPIKPISPLPNREVASSDVPPRKIKTLTNLQQMQEVATPSKPLSPPSTPSNPFGGRGGYPYSHFQHHLYQQRQQQYFSSQQFASPSPLSVGVPAPATPVPNLLTLADVALQYGQLPSSSSASSSSSPTFNSQNFYKYSQSGGGCYIDPSYKARPRGNQTHTTSSAQTTISSSDHNKQRQNIPPPPPPPYHHNPSASSSSSSSSASAAPSTGGKQPHFDSINTAYGGYQRLRQMGVKPLIDLVDIKTINIDRTRDPQAHKRIEFFTHLALFNANVMVQTSAKSDQWNFRNNQQVRENYMVLLNSLLYCVLTIKNILNGSDLK